MLNGAKISKVVVVWATILYVICVLIAWLIPGLYSWGAGNLIHFGMVTSAPSLTLTGVIFGLVIWDVIIYAAVWLFVLLYNRMK